MGASPMGVPSGNPGQQANALSQLREGLNIIQNALPNLPMGSELHKAALSAIQNLSKHVSPSDQVPGVQQTTLKDMAQRAQQSGMLQSLMRAQGAQGSSGGANMAGGGGLPASSGPPAPA